MIHKELFQINKRKTLKGKRINKHFTEEKTEHSNKYIKGYCLIFNQEKCRLMSQWTTVRHTKLKKILKEDNRSWWAMEKGDFSYVSGMCINYPVRLLMWAFSDPEIIFLCI